MKQLKPQDQLQEGPGQLTAVLILRRQFSQAQESLQKSANIWNIYYMETLRELS